MQSIVNDFKSISKWALLNLLITALMGLVMRLKLVMALPFVDQKSLLLGHSHFAFFAWIGLCSMLFTVRNMYDKTHVWPRVIVNFFKFYMVNSWVLLLVFVVGGWSWIANISLLLHLVLCVWYALWWNANKYRIVNDLARKAIGLGIVFNLVAFAGPVLLSYFMLTHVHNVYTTQNAVYIFLHYQYNGYFLLTLLGLSFLVVGAVGDQKRLKLGLYVYAAAVVLGIGLLLLMRQKPAWLIGLNAFVSLLLVIALGLLIPPIIRAFKRQRVSYSKYGRVLFLLSLAGFCFKTLLQAMSAIPAIGYMVYEHRSIAIGYLHLVFFIICTFFYLGLWAQKNQLGFGAKLGLVLFVLSVLVNEVLLSLQGLGAILHLLVPYTNQLLAVIAAVMFCGVALIYLNFIDRMVESDSY